VSVDRLKAVLRVAAQAELGEGPVWDPISHDLLWVDVLGPSVHRFRPGEETEGPTITLDRHVTAVAPRTGGGLVMATAGAFLLFDAQGKKPTHVVPVESDRLNNRMNDGKADPAGRFWAGTMAYAATPGQGSLYRLDVDLSVTTMLRDVTISNGLGWSADGRTMYYIDSPTQGVDAFAFDPSTGDIADRRRLIDVPPEIGMPDGLTIDEEGGIWVALWGGSSVHRYLPNGTLDRIVELPCSLVTSCTFGGDSLDELFITTARWGLTSEEARAQPLAGGLFSCRTGVTGQSPTPFAG
jgi:sugar lactone lactonase YvrE